MNRATLNTIAACALALTVGVIAGSLRSFSTDLESRPASANDALETPETNVALARAVQNETGARRWLLLVSAAEKATAKDMPGIIRAAGDDYAAVQLLAAHWAGLDAKHMFASLYAECLLSEDAPGALPRRSMLINTLFEEWVKADPTGAVKALNEVPNFIKRDQMRIAAINALMKNDIESGIRMRSEWNILPDYPDMNHVAEWAARDPHHAVEVAAKYNRDFISWEILKQIGKIWAENDPEGGMRFAASLTYAARIAIGPAIIGGWAEKDITAAARFTAEQTNITFRNKLAEGFVVVWGKKDPAAALDWSEENLTGKARTDAVGGIVKAVAEKDLAAAGDLVAGLNAGSTQNRAAASLFEVWFNKGKDQHEAAFEWLATLPDKEARRAALEWVLWNWERKDPEAIRDFIAGPHGDLAPSGLIGQIARKQAGKNPEAAMEWAGGLPANRVPAARTAVLQSWLEHRPEAAMNYTRNLPAGDERTYAIRMITLQYAWQTPVKAGEFLKTLPSIEQEAALKWLTDFDKAYFNKVEAAMKQSGK